jgi:hypothetical protein
MQCTTDVDCPGNLGCVANPLTSVLPSQCLRKCTADTDCAGGFVCRTDFQTTGGFCWSSYPPPVPVPDAGSDAATLPDGSPLDASPDAGSVDAAPDAPTDGSSPEDTGSPTDASADAPG